MAYDKEAYMKYFFSVLIILGLGAGSVFYWNTRAQTSDRGEVQDQQKSVIIEPLFDTRAEKIESGDTFGVIMERAGLSSTTIAQLSAAVTDVYDIARIIAGRSFVLHEDPQTRELRKVTYQVNTTQELVIEKLEDEWIAEVRAIPYDIEVVMDEGEVTSSLYYAALDRGIDERAVIAFAEVFQWTVDFAMDVRVGDTFRLIYEKRYRDGEYVMPGRILAAEYVNAGTPYYAFYFEDGEDSKGYFDEHGDSVQRVFLKAPVEYKYITSGFTTGSRYVEAFDTFTGHRAIDYAAPTGTPVRAVGDGTVVFAGWHKFFGNFVSIRHNETYTTNYAHNSKLYVSYGDKVKQGDTIAAVGSTGFSTGPHLHYEMVKFGTKINPLEEEFPSSEAVSEERREQYFEAIRGYAQQLGIEVGR